MLFDSTLRRELSRAFGATLVVILTIVLTMMLIRTVGQAARGSVSPADVVLVLGYTVLGYLPLILALSLFVAVVLSLGRMYRDSEMAIWFASGVSLARVARPVLRGAVPVLAAIALLQLVAWPWGNRNTLELRERYLQRSDLSRVEPGVFQSSSDGRRVFFVERDEHAAPGDAHNVFILQQTEHGESVTSARRGRLEAEGGQGVLVLDRGERNEVDTEHGTKTRAGFDTYRIAIDEHRVHDDAALPPKALDTLDLLRSPSPANAGELAWRAGLLAAAAILLLLGVGLAATNPRRASNWNLLFALLAFLVYTNLVNLSHAWVAAGRLGLVAALLALHGTALLLALGLIWWREHAGCVARAGRGRPAPRVAGGA